MENPFEASFSQENHEKHDAPPFFLGQPMKIFHGKPSHHGPLLSPHRLGIHRLRPPRGAAQRGTEFFGDEGGIGCGEDVLRAGLRDVPW